MIIGGSDPKYTKEQLLWDEKVVPFYEAGSSIRSLKMRNPLSKVGFYAGDFDDLTPADCVYLQMCRTRCDLMFIGLQSDYSLRLSGRKSLYNTEERAFRLGSMTYVNYICLYDEETCSLCVDSLQPDFIFYGRKMNDELMYSSLIKKDNLVLLDYPWREERVEGKFFHI